MTTFIFGGPRWYVGATEPIGMAWQQGYSSNAKQPNMEAHHIPSSRRRKGLEGQVKVERSN